MIYQKIGHDGKPLCEPGVAALFNPVTGLTWMAKDLSESPIDWHRMMKEGTGYSYAGLIWRPPTIQELETERNLALSDPAANPEMGFRPGFYWSSTPFASSPGVCAWGVYFDDGVVNVNSQYDEAFARLVRGPRAGQ